MSLTPPAPGGSSHAETTHHDPLQAKLTSLPLPQALSFDEVLHQTAIASTQAAAVSCK
jgi:hypothetical protein